MTGITNFNDGQRPAALPQNATTVRLSRRTLASMTTLPEPAAVACFSALLHRPDGPEEISCNPHLPDSIWRRLWGKTRPQMRMALNLCGRELTREQRDLVFARETRAKVLRRLIESNRLEFDEQRNLLGVRGVEEAVLATSWLDPSLRRPFALSAKGDTLLREIALSVDGTFPIDELHTLVASYPQWADSGKSTMRHRLLRILFGRYPTLIDTLIDVNGRQQTAVGDDAKDPLRDMFTAACGSANITDTQAAELIGANNGALLDPTITARHKFALLALLANPRCPHHVVLAVGACTDDVDLLDAVARRNAGDTISGPFKDLPVETVERILPRMLPASGQWGRRRSRPVELLEMLEHPDLPELTINRIVIAVRDDVEAELVENRRQRIEAVHDGILPGRPLVVAYGGPPVNPWTGSPLQAAVDFAVDRLGGDMQAWETLVGLIDDFDGSFVELVELATLI